MEDRADRARRRGAWVSLALMLLVPVLSGCKGSVNGSYGGKSASGTVTIDPAAWGQIMDTVRKASDSLGKANGQGPGVQTSAGNTNIPDTSSTSRTTSTSPPATAATTPAAPAARQVGPEPDLSTLAADQARAREIEAEMKNAGGRDGARLNEELQRINDRIAERTRQWTAWDASRRTGVGAPNPETGKPKGN